MDHIYENFKSKSKFLKTIEEVGLNLSGQPTTSGAAPGANPGANPGVITPTTQVTKAQADVDKAQKAAKKATSTQAQMDMNNLKAQMQQLQNAANSATDPVQKQQAQTELKAANARMQQLQNIAKQK